MRESNVRRAGLFFIALVVAASFVTRLLGVQPANRADLPVAGGVIKVTFLDGPWQLSRRDLESWIETSGKAVATYYKRFPMPVVILNIHGTDGRHIGDGLTNVNQDGLPQIDISVGRWATTEDLKRDWMLTHEFVHVAFPSQNRRHHWLEEGLATYVEPWARVRLGTLTAESVWRDVARDMPQGEPEAGDQGLDRTPTWGRTYWGGAIFCLLADVEIREKTNNKVGLDDALIGILSAGGNITQDWTIERTLETGDKAVGVSVMTELYRKMANEPSPVNLNDLWKKLGVRYKDGECSLDDHAPLAAIRRGIEKGTSAS
ncbi:MAG: hypothetical protein JO102_02205 [Elusimicrobia bacterium]|nr:hypothetical protein [Elusimicrobiota bacterium]